MPVHNLHASLSTDGEEKTCKEVSCLYLLILLGRVHFSGAERAAQAAEVSALERAEAGQTERHTLTKTRQVGFGGNTWRSLENTRLEIEDRDCIL